jgi:diacylglycerol kinase
MKMKNKDMLSSFNNAWQGIRQTAARERNFKAHIIIAIAVVAACIGFRVESGHFIWVVVSIFFVLSMELLNTSIEALTDLVTGQKSHPLAKVAKDAAAGAVLLASFMAVIVGLVVVSSVLQRYL